MSANEQQDATCEVAIIGAGPSGLAAAAVLREHGVGVTIIDEQPRAGGQILRQPPRNFSVAHWLPAKLYDRVKAALHAVNERQDIDWRFQSTVLGIMRPSPYRMQRAASPGVTGTEFTVAAGGHTRQGDDVASRAGKEGGGAGRSQIGKHSGGAGSESAIAGRGRSEADGGVAGS